MRIELCRRLLLPRHMLLRATGTGQASPYTASGSNTGSTVTSSTGQQQQQQQQQYAGASGYQGRASAQIRKRSLCIPFQSPNMCDVPFGNSVLHSRARKSVWLCTSRAETAERLPQHDVTP